MITGSGVILNIPRESAEWIGFDSKVKGQVVTTGVETSVTALVGSRPIRPTAWTAAEVRDGETLIRVAGLQPGTYAAWSRTTRDDESAVVFLGYFSIS